jgi:uncharacterized protein (DUF2267 family)
MATTGLDVFDRSVHKTNEWLKDLMERLGSDDRRYAYRVLRAYLHVLRDRLTVDEAAQLAGPSEASMAAETATAVLRERVVEGEVEDVLQLLPVSIRTILQPAGRP